MPLASINVRTFAISASLTRFFFAFFSATKSVPLTIGPLVLRSTGAPGWVNRRSIGFTSTVVRL